MHSIASGTSAFIALSDKSWILDLGAFTHMTGTKDKFHSFFFSSHIPHNNIVDGTSSTLWEKVIHATPLSLNDVLFVSKFSVSLLSIANVLHKIVIVQYFTFLLCFRTCKLGGLVRS